MYKLTVPYSFFSILYGKARTMVKAFQAQRAFFFCPYRIATAAVYGVLWTLTGALLAVNTLFPQHMKVFRIALMLIG